ncbi:hypothetical protein ACFQS6_12335 [Xanthomonas populi]
MPYDQQTIAALLAASCQKLVARRDGIASQCADLYASVVEELS